jgi:hypothetical protein
LGGGSRGIIASAGSWQKCETLFAKQTKTKRTGSVTEVVEHFPRKHERPEFNPHYHQKKNKTKQEKTEKKYLFFECRKRQRFSLGLILFIILLENVNSTLEEEKEL